MSIENINWMVEKTCPICGSIFISTPGWRYKRLCKTSGKLEYFCRWSCYRENAPKEIQFVEETSPYFAYHEKKPTVSKDKKKGQRNIQKMVEILSFSEINSQTKHGL